jgi:hypothetical protein
MEYLSQLERTIHGWFKAVPHLPPGSQKWLADNVWWIAAVGAVLTGITALGFFVNTMGELAALNNPFVLHYASTSFATWVITKMIISTIFIAIECVLLALAIAPLKEKQKNGWNLLFASLLVSALAVFVNAFLTLNAFAFITNIIFGALWLAIYAYLIFEIHGQFSHVERSKGVKAKKKNV